VTQQAMPWKATVEYQNEIAMAFANTQRPFKSLAMTTIHKKTLKIVAQNSGQNSSFYI